MSNHGQIDQQIRDISEMIRTRLGIGGTDFRRQIRRARRHLPVSLRSAADQLSEAQGLAAHPRLARTLDPERVSAAETALRTHLTGIDIANRRKGRILGVLAGLVFNLLAVMILLGFFLKWRGYL